MAETKFDPTHVQTDGKTTLLHQVVIALLPTFLLLFRRPEPLFLPSFFAEDGPIFFTQGYERGLHAVLVPYNGYLHTYQRIVSLLSAPFPLEWAPTLFLIGALASMVILGALLASRRCILGGAPFLAIAVVLTAHTGEVFENLTNTQWIGGLILGLVLISRDPEGRGDLGLDLALAFVFGLTGVFSILLSPLFVLRAIQRKSFPSIALAAVCVVTAGVQAYFVVHSPLVVAPSILDVSTAIRLIGFRMVLGTFLGPACDEVSVTIQICAGFVGILTTLWFLSRTSTKRPTWYLAVAAVLIVTATLYRYRSEPLMLGRFFNGDRYFFVPKIFVVWIFVSELGKWVSTRWLRATRLAVVAVLAAIAASFRTEPLALFPWGESIAGMRPGEARVIRINPQGFSFLFRLKQR